MHYFYKNLHIVFPVRLYSSPLSFLSFTSTNNNMNVVKFLLEHKFEVAKFGQYGFNQKYSSPQIPLVYNNVSIYWCLHIYPKGGKFAIGDTEYRSICGLFVHYCDGPRMKIPVSVKTWVLRNNGTRLFCFWEDFYHFVRNGQSFGTYSNRIPTNIQALIKSNCLSESNTVLHIQAEFDIPVDAFDDPNNVSLAFTYDFFKDAFDTINSQVDDDDRFEIISQDKRHFWVHKHIMAYRSPVFKAMFNSDAGLQGRMSECRNRTVYIDVSGAALELILRYMYLGDVSQLTDRLIKEVLLFASTHSLDDLKAVCEARLIKKFQGTGCTLDDVVDMSIDAEKYGLKKLKQSCISFLAKRWIGAFDKGSCVLNRLFPDEIGQAFLKDLFANTEIQKKLT